MICEIWGGGGSFCFYPWFYLAKLKVGSFFVSLNKIWGLD